MNNEFDCCKNQKEFHYFNNQLTNTKFNNI